MNLQAIYIANITGFILILFLFISRLITQTRSQAEDHIFNVMMFLSLFACLVEPITFTVDGKPGVVAKWVNLLGNTYLYFANGIGSFFWCMYVDRKLYHDLDRVRRIYKKISVVVIIMMATLFVNIPFGYYFYVDEANVYHREPLIYVFYVYLMLCCAWSVISYYIYRHRHGKIAFFPIFMFLGPVVTGSVLQMIFFGISLAWLGVAVGIVALYMSLLNQRSYLDNLTGLYNRMYLEHMYYEIQKNPNTNYYGIMLDMNYFKEINDTHGHSAGDQALCDTAKILHNSADSSVTMFRYAGDEFIILMKTDREDLVAAFETRLREKTERFNEENGRPYRLSFAMGHAAYDHEKDDEDTFLKKIDAAMYENKARMHEEFEIARQGAV